MEYDIKRSIEHIGETNEIRRLLWRMDEKVEDLSYGVQQGDDCIVIGDLVVNMEGPYPLKIGRKTGLVHTCSDVVVMGAKALFALNAMQVDSVEQASEVASDLKKQSEKLEVPMIGGNTQLENNLNPCVSFTVVGKLLDKPIPDAGALDGDLVIMLGEVVEGDIGERCYRAKTKFKTYLELIEKEIEIHAAKDASRGGWFGNLAEMMVKSKRGIRVTSIPYPDMGRYMGNYLVTIPESEMESVISIAAKHKCPVVEVGEVVGDEEILLGNDVVVDKEKFRELVKNTPYRKSKI
jgi:selenophosphate synthetase-related protein